MRNPMKLIKSQRVKYKNLFIRLQSKYQTSNYIFYIRALLKPVQMFYNSFRSYFLWYLDILNVMTRLFDANFLFINCKRILAFVP